MTALAETVVGGGGGGSPQSPPKPPRESRGSWEHSDKGTGLRVRLIHRSRRTEAPPCSTGPPHRRPTRLLPAGRVGCPRSNEARVPQLLSQSALEPAHSNEEWPLLATTMVLFLLENNPLIT